MVNLNKMGIGTLAGLISGLIAGGVGSRMAMRIVALVTSIPISPVVAVRRYRLWRAE